MPFELSLDDSGKPIITDKGVTYHDPVTGKQAVYNVNELMDSIREKNGEAATHRKDKEAAMQQLTALQQTFEGVDPEKARKALETVSSLDAGKLLEAGKVDEIKRQIALDNEQRFNQLSKSLETTKTEAQAQLAEKEKVIEDLLIDNGITSSSFILEETTLPPDVAMAYLRSHFKVEYEDGKPVVRARDSQGNIVLSPTNAAKFASVNEACQEILGRHPQRDSFMKDKTSGTGSGMKPGGGAGGGGAKTIAREAFEKLSPEDKAAKMKEGFSIA